LIEFQWLWAFIALPLPILVYYIVPATKEKSGAALKVPFIKDFRSPKEFSYPKRQKLMVKALGFLAWSLLIIATARPQWFGEIIELPVSGRDLLLAVDLSGSMEIEDFVIKGKPVDRLTATKFVARDFIDRRVGDRLGLILFGRQAYLQTPLTFDRETVKTLLLESVIGLAGRETAIGDAIGLAIKRFRRMDTDSEDTAKDANIESDKENASQIHTDKILILLTDGANTAGEIEPLKAAKIAAQEGLKIYTIGVGADEMKVRSFLGTRTVNPSKDLDEETLSKIAQLTGGKYFRAKNTKGLDIIYNLLDELEPIVQESLSFRPKKSLYPWPLGLALAIISLVLLSNMVRLYRPN